MKNFRRSLRYLWPYRFRLAVSVACVLLIAGLWFGGLGMIAPAMKILISPEGLHGWAWNSLTEDKLGARIVQRRPSGGIEGDRAPEAVGEVYRMSEVIDVVRVKDDSPAQRAGVLANEWIVGLDDKCLRADELARSLAEAAPGAPVRLRVYNQLAGAARTVDVTLDEPGLGSATLGRIARALPEPQDRPSRFRLFVILLGVLLIATWARDLLRFFQEYLVETAVVRGTMDLRRDIYDTSLRLPVTFFSEKGTSDTMSRFVQDTNELSRGQVTLLGKTLAEPAKAIASIAVAMVCSWQLTLAAMVAGPPAFFLIRKFGRRMKRASRRALESWASMLAILGETLTGIRVVKAYTMEAAERKRFFQINRGLLKQQRRMAAIDAATAPTVEALGMTAGALAAGAAGYLVFHDKMEAGIFLTWMAALAAMFDPVRKLSKVVTRFQRSESAAARIFELRDRPLEKYATDAPMLPRHSRSIEFRSVSYRYPGAAEDALKEVTLRIEAGQSLAIVGPNGCGKTTLVSLIPRLLEPAGGSVLVDGTDIRNCSVRSLRRQISLVPQEAVLFHGTIAENVAYGKRRARSEEIRAAARQAFVEDFVADMSAGYDTVVGEHGATLSGGQRQRIAVARAILRDPAILIFDEAMSQVDPDSEQKIQRAMSAFMKGRTSLVVAHRFATVLQADRIAVMDAGRIVDIGDHASLLARCGLYRQLYQTQLTDEEEGRAGQEKA